MKLLDRDRLRYYTEKEDAENRKVDNQPWVLGHYLYHDRIAEVLDNCIDALAGGVIEIGCLHGECSKLLAPVCYKWGRQLLCIDPWDARLWEGHDWGDAFSRFSENMHVWIDKGVVKVVRALSQSPEAIEAMREMKAWDGIAFVFVDGSHAYEDVLADLNNVMPITNGIIVVDDLFSGDVQQALKEALVTHPEWRVTLNRFPVFGEVYLTKGGA